MSHARFEEEMYSEWSYTIASQNSKQTQMRLEGALMQHPDQPHTFDTCSLTS
jgi:hypothetical protein